MEYINEYSYFLMDKALLMLKESVDYEWDLVNNTTTDHTNNKKYKQIIQTLKKSLEQSKDKEKWYERLLNKIKKFKPSVKKSILTAILPILVSVLSINSVVDTTDRIDKDLTELVGLKVPKVELAKVELAKVELEKFMKDMAHRESSTTWDTINNHGYMGLFQIGKTALKDITQHTDDPELKDIHKKVTVSKFKANPDIFPEKLQKKAFVQLLKNNKHYMRNYYDHVGTVINGIKITEAGMLAGAHLVGNLGVKKFLKSNGKKDPTDGNGVHVSEYMKQFSNYKLEL